LSRAQSANYGTLCSISVGVIGLTVCLLYPGPFVPLALITTDDYFRPIAARHTSNSPQSHMGPVSFSCFTFRPLTFRLMSSIISPASSSQSPEWQEPPGWQEALADPPQFSASTQHATPHLSASRQRIPLLGFTSLHPSSRLHHRTPQSNSHLGFSSAQSISVLGFTAAQPTAQQFSASPHLSSDQRTSRLQLTTVDLASFLGSTSYQLIALQFSASTQYNSAQPTSRLQGIAFPPTSRLHLTTLHSKSRLQYTSSHTSASTQLMPPQFSASMQFTA